MEKSKSLPRNEESGTSLGRNRSHSNMKFAFCFPPGKLRVLKFLASFSEPMGKDFAKAVPAQESSFPFKPQKRPPRWLKTVMMSLTGPRCKYITQLFPCIKSSSWCLANIDLVEHHPVLISICENTKSLLLFLVIFWIIHLPFPSTSYIVPMFILARLSKNVQGTGWFPTLDRQHGMKTFILCSTRSPLLTSEIPSRSNHTDTHICIHIYILYTCVYICAYICVYMIYIIYIQIIYIMCIIYDIFVYILDHDVYHICHIYAYISYISQNTSL